jgi:hypothetical protein
MSSSSRCIGERTVVCGQRDEQQLQQFVALRVAGARVGQSSQSSPKPLHAALLKRGSASRSKPVKHLDGKSAQADRTPTIAIRLGDEFPGLLKGPIQRFELDHLGALNFVLVRALEGGVNESLNLDAHGKSWSCLLLGLEVELNE